MKKTTEIYRKCQGSIEWDEDEQEYHGKITSGIPKDHIVDYWAKDRSDLQHEFESSVDCYFDFMEELKVGEGKAAHIVWAPGY